MIEEIINLENCYKIYRDNISHIETVAIRGIDLTIYKGELISIIGVSGSGKSTLLNLIGGLDQPNAGRVFFSKDSKKINLTILSSSERDKHRIKHIGYLQQKPLLLPHYTAIENVELPLLSRGVSNSREKAELWLQKLGIRSELWNSRPQQLSGGERQRVSLASALVFNPKILLADEPTAEVDQQTANEILTIFKNLVEEYKMTIIIVTHDLKLAQGTDRSFILEDGIITRRKIIKKMTYILNTDKYSRIQFPKGVMDTLDNPDLIYLHKLKEGYELKNAEKLDIQIDDHDLLIAVDKTNKIKLKLKSDSYIINIDGNRIIMEENNK